MVKLKKVTKKNSPHSKAEEMLWKFVTLGGSIEKMMAWKAVEKNEGCARAQWHHYCLNTESMFSKIAFTQ